MKPQGEGRVRRSAWLGDWLYVGKIILIHWIVWFAVFIWFREVKDRWKRPQERHVPSDNKWYQANPKLRIILVWCVNKLALVEFASAPSSLVESDSMANGVKHVADGYHATNDDNRCVNPSIPGWVLVCHESQSGHGCDNQAGENGFNHGGAKSPNDPSSATRPAGGAS